MVLGIDAGLTAYRAVAMALVLLTGLASYRFLRAMAPRLNKELTFTMALAWLLLFLHVMPDASEGFYWYTGAVTYQLANALSLFFLANWLSAWRRTEIIGVRWYVVQVLLLLWMAGSNEVHMAYLVIGHAVLVFLSRKETGPRRRAAIILLGVAIIAGMVVALAPGNATRESLFPLRHDVVRTLAYSVGQTGRWALSWALPLILPSILFLVLLRKGEERGLLSWDGLRWNRWAALALPFRLSFREHGGDVLAHRPARPIPHPQHGLLLLPADLVPGAHGLGSCGPAQAGAYPARSEPLVVGMGRRVGRHALPLQWARWPGDRRPPWWSHGPL
ncbi:MAG: hypothetical protein H6592_05670 [Flavobacteriales bacterium]|nr:hypothetical protein [Flavobacteriales bacterium]